MKHLESLRPWTALFRLEFRRAVGGPLAVVAFVILGFRLTLWAGLWRRFGDAGTREAFNAVLAALLLVLPFALAERAFSPDLKSRRIYFLAVLPLRRVAVWAALVLARLGVLAATWSLALILWPDLFALGAGEPVLRAILLVVGSVAFFGFGSVSALVSPRPVATYLIGFSLAVLCLLLGVAYFSWTEGDLYGLEQGNNGVAHLLATGALAALLLYIAWRLFARGELNLPPVMLRGGLGLLGAIALYLLSSAAVATFAAEWLVGRGEVVQSWLPLQGEVFEREVSPDGRRMQHTRFWGNNLSRIQVIDLSSGEASAEVLVRGDWTSSWSADGAALHILGEDPSPWARWGLIGRPRPYWRVLTTNSLQTLPAPSQRVAWFSALPDGRYLLALGRPDATGAGRRLTESFTILNGSSLRPEQSEECVGSVTLEIEGGQYEIVCRTWLPASRESAGQEEIDSAGGRFLPTAVWFIGPTVKQGKLDPRNLVRNGEVLFLPVLLDHEIYGTSRELEDALSKRLPPLPDAACSLALVSAMRPVGQVLDTGTDSFFAQCPGPRGGQARLLTIQPGGSDWSGIGAVMSRVVVAGGEAEYREEVPGNQVGKLRLAIRNGIAAWVEQGSSGAQLRVYDSVEGQALHAPLFVQEYKCGSFGLHVEGDSGQALVSLCGSLRFLFSRSRRSLEKLPTTLGNPLFLGTDGSGLFMNGWDVISRSPDGTLRTVWSLSGDTDAAPEER